MGTEIVLEEAFMDVFCDLMYGGGWMEIEREEVDRVCNGALVSAADLSILDDRHNVFHHRRPSSSRFRQPGRLSLAVSTRALPPRSLFEEFVLLEYRQQWPAAV